MSTLVFDEKVKGWVSFFGYTPEWMISVGSRFYTFKNANLYEHDTNTQRGNFYGNPNDAVVTTIINDAISDDKVYKTVILEGNKAWETSFVTNYTGGTIKESEYNNRESRWFAHIRKNENEADLSGSAAQGIGSSDSTTATTATFLLKPTNVYVGDTLFQIATGNTPQEVGEIQSISDKTITLTNVINAPAQNTFMFAKKNARIDGAEIRGRFLEITLRSDETDFIECFAVNVRAIKSYL